MDIGSVDDGAVVAAASNTASNADWRERRCRGSRWRSSGTAVSAVDATVAATVPAAGAVSLPLPMRISAMTVMLSVMPVMLLLLLLIMMIEGVVV